MSQPWHLWKKFWRSENSFSHPPAVQPSTQKNPIQPIPCTRTTHFCKLLSTHLLLQPTYTPLTYFTLALLVFSLSWLQKVHSRKASFFTLPLSISLCILSINILCIFSSRLSLISQSSSLQMHIFRYPSFYNPWLLISVTIPYRVQRCLPYRVQKCIISPVLWIYSVYFDPASSCFLNQLFWPLPFLASPHFLWAPISTLLTWLPAQILI